MSGILETLRSGLVVSCQAALGDPLEDTETIRRIARSVAKAGAAGLRINSPEQIAAIRQDLKLPIIGIQKRYHGKNIRITPDFASAVALASAGASIIALDCTGRDWPDGEPWQLLIERIHRELRLPVMADVSTLEEAVVAKNAGADVEFSVPFKVTIRQHQPETSGPSASAKPTVNSESRKETATDSLLHEGGHADPPKPQ